MGEPWMAITLIAVTITAIINTVQLVSILKAHWMVRRELRKHFPYTDEVTID